MSKKKALRIFLIPTLPVVIYYFFYFMGILAAQLDFAVQNCESCPAVLTGLCFTVAIALGCFFLSLIIWFLWWFAGWVMEFVGDSVNEINEIRNRRRERNGFLPREQAAESYGREEVREVDPEQSYLQRIGMEED